MGQKVHPIGFRLGVIKTWDSKWFEHKNYAQWLHEDIRIREFVKKSLGHAGVSKVEIERAAAKPVAKLIQSAVANATDLSKGQVDVDALYVKTISVDQGPTLKRFMPRAMGRATPIHKKSSHVHVVLADTPVRSRKARS